MKVSEYTAYDATDLANLVKSKQVTAHELLDCALAQMDKVNPLIHAVIRTFADEARRTIDQSVDESAPFAGVPFLLKDLLGAYAGQEMNSGSAFLKGFVPVQDSELVRRYKQAGLVIFGKTNTPEFGLAPYTEPVLHGVTRNPWNLNHSAGGSSGGSAAAVAARVVPVAGAGDGGGSIRIPASICGLVGLKPSRGRVPSGPQIPDGWFGMISEHVISRTVRDSAAFLDATCGDYAAQLLKIQPPTQSYADIARQSPRPLKIGYSTDGILGGVLDEDNVTAVKNTIKQLQDLGHHIEEVNFKHVDGAEFLYQYVIVLCADTATLLQYMQKICNRRVTAQDVEPRTWALAMLGHYFSAKQLMGAHWYFQQFSRDWLTRYHHYDAILTSTLAQKPAVIGQHAKLPGEDFQHLITRLMPFMARLGTKRDMVLKSFDTILQYMPQTMVANVTGQPAISVPTHTSTTGLPVGTMLMGRYGDEATLLQIAQQLEQCYGWQKLQPSLA